MRSWVLALVALSFIWLLPARAQVPEDLSRTAKTVLACYSQGSRTVLAMRNCAKVWVTPRILLLCAAESHCAALHDNDAGRTMAMAEVGPQGVATALVLAVANLPPMPTAPQIADCKQKTHAADAFVGCVANAMQSSGPVKPILDCVRGKSRDDQARCLADQSGNDIVKNATKCLAGKARTSDAVLECSGHADLIAKVKAARDCAASTDQGKRAACLVPGGDANGIALARCTAQAGEDRAATLRCLGKAAPDLAVLHQDAVCLSTAGSDPLHCGRSLLNGPAAVASACLLVGSNKHERDICALQSVPDFAHYDAIANCMPGNSTIATIAACETPFLGHDASRFAGCTGGAPGKLQTCLAGVSPRMAQAVADLGCMQRAGTPADSFRCLAPHLGGDAPKFVACISDDRDKMTDCLLGTNPRYKVAVTIYQCASGGTDAGDLIENCSADIIKDPTTRHAVACVARSGGDEGELAGCAATAIMPPEVARLVGCAASSEAGLTSFAICGAGVLMNEEWRIAAECAVDSGGVPVTFAVCTAGRLVVRELTKCFTGGSCFGPDNTVVVGLRDVFHDVTQGPGKNNEIVKAVVVLEQATGGPNSVVNNPGQILGGKNSVFHNPAQLANGLRGVPAPVVPILLGLPIPPPSLPHLPNPSHPFSLPLPIPDPNPIHVLKSIFG